MLFACVAEQASRDWGLQRAGMHRWEWLERALDIDIESTSISVSLLSEYHFEARKLQSSDPLWTTLRHIARYAGPQNTEFPSLHNARTRVVQVSFGLRIGFCPCLGDRAIRPD